MNIYILTDHNKTYYLHELGKKLQNKGICNKLGIRVAGEKQYQYIQKQSEVDYDYIHSVHKMTKNFRSEEVNRDKIKTLEQNFGNPFLQKYVLGDRNCIEFSHKNQIRYLQRLFTFYEEFFDRFKPDIVLADGIASAPNWIPFRIVRDYGGHGLWWHSTRVNNRYAFNIDSVYEDFQEIYNLYDQIRTGEIDPYYFSEARRDAKEYIQKFRDKDLTKSTPHNKNNIKQKIRKFALAAPRYLRYSYLYNISSHSNIQKNDLTRPSTLKRVSNDMKQIYRNYRIKYTDVFDRFSNENKFVYFPLHLQPEYSTMLLAPMHLNQIEVIRKISRSIPINYKLYVKEHPHMIKYRGWRNLDYYKEIRNIPNVELLDPYMSSQRLIKQSEMVATITGTAGLEALFHEKPVIVFGDPHYKKVPLIYKSTSSKEIANQIQNGLTEYKHEDKPLIEYLTSVFEKSFQIDADKGDRNQASQAADEVFPHLVERINKIPSSNMN